MQRGTGQAQLLLARPQPANHSSSPARSSAVSPASTSSTSRSAAPRCGNGRYPRRCAVLFCPDQSGAGPVRGRKVRAIAAATAKAFRNCRTCRPSPRQDLPFVYDSWFGLMAPAGVPKPILEKISKDWAEAIKTLEMEARIKGQYLIGVTIRHRRWTRSFKDEDGGLDGGRSSRPASAARLRRIR